MSAAAQDINKFSLVKEKKFCDNQICFVTSKGGECPEDYCFHPIPNGYSNGSPQEIRHQVQLQTGVDRWGKRDDRGSGSGRPYRLAPWNVSGAGPYQFLVGWPKRRTRI